MTLWPINAGASPPHPRGWVWRPLTSVAELVTGHTPDRKRPDYWNGGISWVNLNEIRKLDGRVCRETELQISPAGVANSSAVVHPAGTVCLSRTASVGFVTIMGAPMATSQDFVNWICGPGLDPKYLMAALRASRPNILGMCSGSTHKTMYVRQAERLQVLLPPLEEQRRIVAILDKANDLIANRRAALEQLDSLTQAIFLDMFGEPVVNPRGWPVVQIGEVTTSATYGTAQKASSEGAVPVLRMGNLTATGAIDTTDLKFLDRADEKHLLRPGDVLFNRTNSADLVGKTAVFRLPGEWAYAGYLVRLRLTEEAAPDYVGTFMNLPTTKRRLRSMCKAIVGQANINAKELQRIPMPLPPLGLQADFARRLDAVERAKRQGSAGECSLDGLASSLQSRAFRGEL